MRKSVDFKGFIKQVYKYEKKRFDKYQGAYLNLYLNRGLVTIFTSGLFRLHLSFQTFFIEGLVLLFIS